MDKYVIDLDKVLDELELNDKFDNESNHDDQYQQQNRIFSDSNYDQTILHRQPQQRPNQNLVIDQFQLNSSFINLNDKIDFNDADFSIHTKPPKLLTSSSSTTTAAASATTTTIIPTPIVTTIPTEDASTNILDFNSYLTINNNEHNNDIQTNVVRQPIKPVDFLSYTNEIPERHQSIEDINEIIIDRDVFHDDIPSLATNDKQTNLPLNETISEETTLPDSETMSHDLSVIDQPTIENVDENSISEKTTKLNNEKLKCDDDKIKYEPEICDMKKEEELIDFISTNKSDNDDDGGGKGDGENKSDIEEQIPEEKEPELLTTKENIIINEPEPVVSVANEKLVDQIANPEKIDLNEDVIGKMDEKDLDKYLDDLNDDLENMEKIEAVVAVVTSKANKDNDNEMENIRKEQEDESISESNTFVDSTIQQCDNTETSIYYDVQSSSINEHENDEEHILNKELDDIDRKETETQLQELEELLLATNSTDNNNVNSNNNSLQNNSDNIVVQHDPETRGGLVQNINYFERQEMPNGLTEEEQMLGKVKPFWIPDEEAQNCLHCDVKFTLIKRRHHCRSCGKVLCSQCCNYKAKLPYLDFKEARVCQLCYAILMRIEAIERINGHQLDISQHQNNSQNLNNSEQSSMVNDDHNNIPDPNNPAEYCSTIPPLEQIKNAEAIPPPTVMVPVGVLKRPGSSNLRRNSPESSSGGGESSTPQVMKQVMFSDGVRPGGDLVETPSTSNNSNNRLPNTEEKSQITRTQLQLKSPLLSEKILVPFENFSKRIKMTRIVVIDNKGVGLPPIINYNELKSINSSSGPSTSSTIMTTLPSKPNYNQLLAILRDERLPPVTFGLTKNLHINCKIISKTCCNSKECWSFSSKGLASVGQDEILLVLDCDSLKKSSLSIDSLNSSQQQNNSDVVGGGIECLEFPRDVFRLYTTIYDSASAANLYMDLTHIFFPDGLFNNKENSGFIFTRPTLQCYQNIHIPSPPFLIAVLIHKWEIPWAKVFPLRLVLRLGYEYKMYPSPVISYANRKSAYFEIGHTIMNVLADFRNFHYTLSVVKDLFICVEDRKRVDLLIPKLSYEKMCKVLSTSNEHVLAFGGNLSLKADSHFVCIQNEDDDDGTQYHTQVSSYSGSPQKITGASFIVFSGALKSTTGLKAKMNIVEDGLLVQIPSMMMEELRSAIKDMKDFKIDCCKVTETSSDVDEFVQLKWVNDDLSTNLGVRSQIDGLNLEGVQSARIFSNPDYANERYLIRWIEVFLLQINENSRRSEMINANRLAESVAQAFCVALIDYLDQLYENGLTKISLRISLDVDKVGYETGSGGKPLPPQITQRLDGALIPVIMENISTTGIEDPLVIELLFFVLIK